MGKLANQANTSTSSSTITSLPYQDIKKSINIKYTYILQNTNILQTSWNKITISKKLKSIKKKVTKFYTQPHAPWRSEIINSWTRIGHTNLAHIYVIKNEEQPLCSQCNKPLSTKHIQTHRLRLPAICQRKKHHRPIFSFDTTPTWSIASSNPSVSTYKIW